MKMKIRRYLGYDCDSINGFNNGHYIDDNFIEVNSISEAYEACFQGLEDHYYISSDDVTEIEHGFEYVTGYFDDSGNEIDKEEFQALEHDKGSYRYVYVTFEEVPEEEKK